MRSVSMRIRLRGAKRRVDHTLGEEMPGMETAKRRNGETRIRRLAGSPIRRFDAIRHRPGRDV